MLQFYLALIEEETDKERFEKAYWKYRNLMFWAAQRILSDEHLAEEAVQEAFLRIARNFRKVGDIDSRQTRNFFVMITERTALSELEKEKKHRAWTAEKAQDIMAEDEGTWNPVEPAIPDAAFDAYSHGQLVDAILELPEIYRQVLYLLGVYEYDMKETAALLDLSVETVKKRAQRGRRMLRESLEKEGDLYG